jgi:hypothetical protein
MEKKICSKCEVEMDVCYFTFRNDRKKYRNQCNLCLNKMEVIRYSLNPDNKKKRVSLWRINNPEKYDISNKKWRENNLKDYRKNKKENDPLYSFTHRIRSRIRSFMKTIKITKKNKTFDIIGCSPASLKEHIEKQFTEGMSWDKMGQYIHIDHIIPLNSAKTEEEVYKLCHYTNLQPLWAQDNLKKSDKII